MKTLLDTAGCVNSFMVNYEHLKREMRNGKLLESGVMAIRPIDSARSPAGPGIYPVENFRVLMLLPMRQQRQGTAYGQKLRGHGLDLRLHELDAASGEFRHGRGLDVNFGLLPGLMFNRVSFRPASANIGAAVSAAIAKAHGHGEDGNEFQEILAPITGEIFQEPAAFWPGGIDAGIKNKDQKLVMLRYRRDMASRFEYLPEGQATAGEVFCLVKADTDFEQTIIGRDGRNVTKGGDVLKLPPERVGSNHFVLHLGNEMVRRLLEAATGGSNLRRQSEALPKVLVQIEDFVAMACSERCRLTPALFLRLAELVTSNENVEAYFEAKTFEGLVPARYRHDGSTDLLICRAKDGQMVEVAMTAAIMSRLLEAVAIKDTAHGSLVPAEYLPPDLVEELACRKFFDLRNAEIDEVAGAFISAPFPWDGQQTVFNVGGMTYDFGSLVKARPVYAQPAPAEEKREEAAVTV